MLAAGDFGVRDGRVTVRHTSDVDSTDMISVPFFVTTPTYGTFEGGKFRYIEAVGFTDINFDSVKWHVFI